MTPSTFRRKGEGVEIRYTVVPTELGKLLIASTPRGICSVQFGASADAMISELKREFHAATIEQDRGGLQEIASKLTELVSGVRVSLNVARDIHGTAFQH